MRNSLGYARVLPAPQEHTQLSLFGAANPICGLPTTESYPSIATTAVVTGALLHGAAVAIGVSGGKDSSAVAIRTFDYLAEMGHSGPRLLIHSDLGRVEWKQSLPVCERLAERLKVDLVVVRRQKGDLLDRFRQRWHDNVRRYAELSCVKLILPWPTAGMRYCTGELKTAVICRELVQRFPDTTILSVSGIRREESSNRAKAPVAAVQPKLTSARLQTSGLDWHPILAWTKAEVPRMRPGQRDRRAARHRGGEHERGRPGLAADRIFERRAVPGVNGGFAIRPPTYPFLISKPVPQLSKIPPLIVG